MTRFERISIRLSAAALFFSLLTPVAAYFWLDPTIQKLRHQPRLHAQADRREDVTRVSIENMGQEPATGIWLALRRHFDEKKNEPVAIRGTNPPFRYDVEVKDNVTYLTPQIALGAGQVMALELPPGLIEIDVHNSFGLQAQLPSISPVSRGGQYGGGFGR